MTSSAKIIHGEWEYGVDQVVAKHGYFVYRYPKDHKLSGQAGGCKYLRNGSWETYGPTYYNHFEYALTALRSAVLNDDRVAVEVEARERRAKEHRRKELTHHLERLVKNKNGLDKSINKVLGEIEALKS